MSADRASWYACCVNDGTVGRRRGRSGGLFIVEGHSGVME